MLEPDQARDTMIENEILAGFSEEAGKAAVAGYEKYRTFLDNGMWGEVVMAKWAGNGRLPVRMPAAPTWFSR
jgi:hypothetical protein